MRAFLNKVIFVFRNYTILQIFKKLLLFSLSYVASYYYRRSLFLKRYSRNVLQLHGRINIDIESSLSIEESQNLGYITDFYLKNTFNILSDKWIDLSRESLKNSEVHVLGFKFKYSKRFVPIKWNEDWVGGYTWPKKTKYHKIKYGQDRGNDVKYPWELGRLQFVVRLLIAGRAAGGELGRSLKNASQEHLIDFIQQNPYGYGVNWSCTMDVAIRAANIAFYLMLSKNSEPKLEELLLRSLEQHVSHIKYNLEWNDTLTSNHYFSNLVGLIVSLYVLPDTLSNRKLLKFAILSFIDEVDNQFDADGANFEGSTCYHRLSSEMMIYGWLFSELVIKDKCTLSEINQLSLPAVIFIKYPFLAVKLRNRYVTSQMLEGVFSRILMACQFLDVCSDIKGNNIQFGDNDNGRFLWMSFRTEKLDEREMLIESFSNHTCREFMEVFYPYNKLHCNKGLLTAIFKDIKGKINFDSIGGGVPLSSRHYTNFGLYTIAKKGLKLFLKAGGLGQLGNGGHDHNDHLSIVLHVDGYPIIVDPGTFSYTRNSEERNMYRSTAMHNTLSIRGIEQNKWLDGPVGLFNLIEKNSSKITNLGRGVLEGEFSNGLYKHIRNISLAQDDIIITDQCDKKNSIVSIHLSPDVKVKQLENTIYIESVGSEICLIFHSGEIKILDYYYSPSYGIKIEAKKIVVELTDNYLTWQIKRL